MKSKKRKFPILELLTVFALVNLVAIFMNPNKIKHVFPKNNEIELQENYEAIKKAAKSLVKDIEDCSISEEDLLSITINIEDGENHTCQTLYALLYSDEGLTVSEYILQGTKYIRKSMDDKDSNISTKEYKVYKNKDEYGNYINSISVVPIDYK